MVYQIYFGDGADYTVLFDIEVYLNKEDRIGGDWQSEIISSAFGSAFIKYFRNEVKGDLPEEMIADSKELEELRGWLYERADFVNTPLSMELASQRHKKVIKYVEEKVYAFAEKYHLYVNVD